MRHKCGRYRAGIRATELRTKTDRGTCVAVGITDEPWELVRTFYVPLEDGSDRVSPIIARAMELLHERGLKVATNAEQHKAPPIDHLADIAHVIRGEHRVRPLQAQAPRRCPCPRRTSNTR